MWKKLFKVLWFGFGAFGLAVVVQKYWPLVNPAELIKGVQGTLVSSQQPGIEVSPEPLNLSDLKNLDPQEVSQQLSQIIKTEITKVLETTTTQIKEFPAKEVKKMKIGACENLLEEDICNVAKDLQCQ